MTAGWGKPHAFRGGGTEQRPAARSFPPGLVARLVRILRGKQGRERAGLMTALDDRARAWMRGYDSARWQEGRGVGTATQQGSQALLEARRVGGLTTHPRTWGGIVAVGVD